jgi:hypothetical protein
MWEPRLLATLGASTVCNRDIFIFYLYLNYAPNQDQHSQTYNTESDTKSPNRRPIFVVVQNSGNVHVFNLALASQTIFCGGI